MFSDRIQTRQRVWWAKPNKWRNRESYHRLFHRIKENHTLRSRNDPEWRWRCCNLWQRTLSNKWNAREFVQRYDIRVPELYWWGRRIGTLPVEALPAHFVIRPIWGDSHRGVYVIAADRDLFRQRLYRRSELVAELRQTRGRVARFPLLVEEFVKTEAGDYALPIEFKFHMFLDTIGGIEVVHRHDNAAARYGFYTPAWTRFADPLYPGYESEETIPPPTCLEQMLKSARVLGAAYGTYVRCDFYATDRGCVFGEFSSTPANGRQFSSFVNRYFEELWQQAFPHRT